MFNSFESEAVPSYIEDENDDLELVDPDEIYFDEWDDDTDWSEEDWDEE
jgi:hypothetical protein